MIGSQNWRARLARDLEWVLGSPALFDESALPSVSNEWCREKLDRARELLSVLKDSPAPLENYLGDLSERVLLGVYFESLLYYWLKEIWDMTELHARLPVRALDEDTGSIKTTGELDFVFLDPEGTVTSSPPGPAEHRHWEAAVKFYLCLPGNAKGPGESPELADFYGPNSRDKLDLKFRKLRDQQLRLPQTPDAKALLQGLGVERIRSEAFVRGMLFYPRFSDWKSHPAPNEIASDHLRGWWATSKEVRRFVQTGAPHEQNRAWAWLERLEWMAPTEVQADVDGLAEASPVLTDRGLTKKLQAHFERRSTSVMLAELTLSEDGHSWREVSRGVIVHPDWPNQG